MRYRRDEHHHGGGGTLKKALPWLLGTSAALWLFWPRNANASQQPSIVTAIVNSGAGAMRLRSGPGTNTAQLGDAPDGSTVTILQRGIAPTDGQGGEWWQIRTAAGLVGYARAVDAQGNHNFR